MALVDKTNFHMNKENMLSKHDKFGEELEKKMQKPMESNMEAIIAAVSRVF